MSDNHGPRQHRGGPSRTGGPGGRADPNRVRLGRAGEQAAADRLSALGFRVLERNYRNRLGEIDIVALEGDILCFIEVKSRRSGAFGGGLEAVEGRKRAQIKRVANYYLTRFGDHPPVCRFDAVEVWLSPKGKPERVHLVRNAF